MKRIFSFFLSFYLNTFSFTQFLRSGSSIRKKILFKYMFFVFFKPFPSFLFSCFCSSTVFFLWFPFYLSSDLYSVFLLFLCRCFHFFPSLPSCFSVVIISLGLFSPLTPVHFFSLTHRKHIVIVINVFSLI